MTTSTFSKFLKILGFVGLGLLTLVIVAVGLIYLWPLRTASLQTTHPAQLTYDQSVERIRALRLLDDQAGARAECRTGFYDHGHKTAKTIVMLHGVGECPQQFEAMGRYFYDHGYNVLIPRAPHFGLPNNRRHGEVTAQELTSFADETVTVGAGLGNELSLIGLSGGGVLATWAAEYRDAVSRLEVLSPFYAPSADQAPVWQRRPLAILYGYGILPDRFDSPAANALSYHALAQYMRIVANLKPRPLNPRLRSVASVVSAGDKAIDHELAQQIPAKLAEANGLNLTFFTPPADWGLGHDIAKAEPNRDINGHSADLYPIYLDLLNK